MHGPRRTRTRATRAARAGRTVSPRPLVSSPLPDSVVIAPRALALVERVGGRRLLRELVELYAGNAPMRVAEARIALAAGDADGVRRACHALKSGSAQLGATRLVDRCVAAEQRAAEDDHTDAAAQLDAIAAALDEALAALHAHVAAAGDAA